MKTRFLRYAVTVTAFAGLLGSALLTGAAPAAAAEKTPTSWESAALGLSAAHRSSQGEGVTVAVLDTGIDENHPALKGRVKDIGPDFYSKYDDLEPGDPNYGVHGTAMASDVLKVAPKADIIAARVTSDEVGDHDLPVRPKGKHPVAQGIDYAVENGADVISMSIGGNMFAEFSGAELAAVGRAVQAGVTILASAGNSAEEGNEGNYPAGLAPVISVAATQQDGSRASFSTVRTHNTIAAPGVGIISANLEGGYRPVQGTSPAGALASGVAALMVAENPDLTPAQVRAILMRTAKHPPGGHNAFVGAGQINAAAAVRAVGNPPKIDTAVKPYKGEEHFAKPTGTEKFRNATMNTGQLAVGIGGAIVGLLCLLIGGFLLLRKKRSAA
ncbi:S8 family peptidase [Streptomyces boluensis]|uniref:S8 family serine peptidase n=1 Tax=Streptomyces boluensis TaxID=1775135 RepID=A0A964ULF6_9ACTN|nr:S8 family serine peptidase [Streptomyces boluensis]NBE51374.1 S8 family serine peptidase [Streptomyces boluensis]